MKKLLFLFLPIALFSCEKESHLLGPSANVNLNIYAVWDTLPLVLNQPLPYSEEQKLQFSELNFFISNVTLLEEESADELDFLEVGLADFSANTSPGAVQPAKFSVRDVPAVSYKAIRLSIGVPSNLNKASVGSYGAGHPLKAAFDTHFWSAGKSFFFLKMAGIFDSNLDGTITGLPEDLPFELFPAKNANFITLTFTKHFSPEDGKPLDLNLKLDVKKLFLEDGKLLDLTDPANLSTYNPENPALSALLMSNFQRALSWE